MVHRHGVILLDEKEIIFRLYETDEHEWKLFHYHSALLTFAPNATQTSSILEIIGTFFSTEYAQHIADWKIASRHIPTKVIKELSRALSLSIEELTPHREQELLCKGMFTELW